MAEFVAESYDFLGMRKNKNVGIPAWKEL